MIFIKVVYKINDEVDNNITNIKLKEIINKKILNIIYLTEYNYND